ILLADDDADDRLFFKEAMEEINVDTMVSFVNDGSQLLYFLNQPDICLPNIIFLDINMPIKNGMECLKEIRSNHRFKNMMIVVYSTSGSENDMQEAFINGADAYLKKPNNFAELKSSLANVLNDSIHSIV
ncbi:MAG TPA: response regulator, partial [Prolixibacteraceae bacterium]|nr:response regulator [Prolixibacteraceae bacterium]